MNIGNSITLFRIKQLSILLMFIAFSNPLLSQVHRGQKFFDVFYESPQFIAQTSLDPITGKQLLTLVNKKQEDINDDGINRHSVRLLFEKEKIEFKESLAEMINEPRESVLRLQGKSWAMSRDNGYIKIECTNSSFPGRTFLVTLKEAQIIIEKLDYLIKINN